MKNEDMAFFNFLSKFVHDFPPLHVSIKFLHRFTPTAVLISHMNYITLCKLIYIFHFGYFICNLSPGSALWTPVQSRRAQVEGP